MTEKTLRNKKTKSFHKNQRVTDTNVHQGKLSLLPALCPLVGKSILHTMHTQPTKTNIQWLNSSRKISNDWQLYKKCKIFLNVTKANLFST